MTETEIRDSAIQNFTVKTDVEGPYHRYIEAEAKTGSRYVVVATRLAEDAAARESGNTLVTVLWPWQDAWVMQAGDTAITEQYVAEHLSDGRARDGRLHPGDLVALTLAVAMALRGRAAL